MHWVNIDIEKSKGTVLFDYSLILSWLTCCTELNGTSINSIRSASEGSSTDYSSMGGLVEFASQALGNTCSTAEPLTPSVINTMVKQIWDDGGMVAGGLFAVFGSALELSF